MSHHQTHDAQSHNAMQASIDACTQCYQTCLHTAMSTCLESGGKHLEASHFRLMMNCVEICQTAVNFMLGHSTFHASVCALCADVCDACAVSCESIDGMDECAKSCRECARSCRAMAAAAQH